MQHDPSPPPHDPPPDLPPGNPPVQPGQLGVYGPGVRPRVPGQLTSDDKTMAMLVHLLAIFTGFVGPLIIWLIKKDDSPYVNAHGRAALNFIFTVMILQFVFLGAVLALMFIGIGTEHAAAFIGLAALYIGWFAWSIVVLVLEIMHCIQASRGEFKPYPMSIRFFRAVDPYA